ncbi:TonB-dependent receptor [Odoribacter laneus]|uniref:TonB-dependent receptor n=1 Tax=Odoribacter laneus TaxID=626933 RepID=UPI003AF0C225
MRYILIILLFFICFPAFTQQSAIGSPDSVYSIVQQLQEVTVIAEKRELSPSDIPVALTVINERSIPGENNPDLRNISGIVPNFYMQEGGLKLSTPMYMRGIGTVSGTPPVGLYVDGVPVFDKNAFVFDLYDIQQIEVLRGPQTTLYGRNSINGLININTRQAGNKFALRGKIGVASYVSQNYNLVIDLPLKKLRNKFSFSYNKSRGYFKNKFENERRSNPTESYNGQYQGNIYAGRNWKIGLGANYVHSFDGGYAYYAVDSLKKERYKVNYNTPSSYKRDLLRSYLSVKKSGQHAAFNWMSSYSWSKDKQILDADFTYLDVFDNYKKSKQYLVTQEINLQSTATRYWDWTIGTFGFYKDLENNYLATFGKDKHFLLPMPLDEATYYNSTTTKGIAGYGQIGVKELWPGMVLTAGLRYDYENVHLNYQDSLLLTGSSQFEAYHSSKKDKSFAAWLPKFSFLQKWEKGISLYANVAKGYKAGGYNIIVNEMSSKFVDLGYEEEELWNYEIGLKYFSPRKKFNLTAALFYIDWKDQQIFVMGMMGPSIKNAGDARSFGGELDLQWEIVPRLTYTFSAGYNHAEYYHHLTQAYEGHRIVMSPEFTGHAGLSYQMPLRSLGFENFVASTTVSGFGTQYFDEANLLKQSPYFLWNLDLYFSGKHIDFHIWGKNLLDKAFFTYMLNNPVGEKLPQYYDMGQSGSPARFGASIAFKI